MHARFKNERPYCTEEANDYPVMVFDAQNTRQESDPVKEGSDCLLPLS